MITPAVVLDEPVAEVLVSIVIINYNYAAYLQTAINSALSQDYSPIEVIVVDDGSTDDSRAILASNADAITPIFLTHGGHSAAVNAGFEKSNGLFVLFLDADDLLYPDCISSAMAEIRPTDTKVQFQLATIDREGLDQAMPFPYFPSGLTSKEVYRQTLQSGWYPWTVCSGNLFARWFLAELLPLDAKWIYRSPDSYLNKLAPLYGAVRTLRKVLGAYRVHGRNAWASSADSWEIGVAIRWLKFNVVLEAAFLNCAAARGVATQRPLLPVFHQLEYRALAVRFSAEKPIPGDRRSAVLADGVRWLAYVHPDGLVGSAARLVWLSFVLVAPRRVVETQMRNARSQSRRSPFWKQALRMSRRE